MKLEIINKSLSLHIYGFSGIALNKDYAGTAFAGVELDEIPIQETGLEEKNIAILKYAYYKHIGPYHLLKQAGQKMNDELKDRGFETSFPYVEIYGHWTNDEMALETELIMCLK